MPTVRGGGGVDEDNVTGEATSGAVVREVGVTMQRADECRPNEIPWDGHGVSKSLQ